MDNKKLSLKYVPINSLKNWNKNPRKNDTAADKLTKLIEYYGFINPVVAKPDNTILAGHTRIKAAKKLNISEVPVIYVDFDNDKATGYAIADNKSSEWADWDFSQLKDLFEELDHGSFDLELTGFELPKIESFMVDVPEPDKNFRQNLDYFHLNLHEPDSYENGFPVIRKDNIDIKGLIGFNECLTASKNKFDNTVHFFLDDYQYERLWSNPEKYINVLKKFNGMLSPLFSLYTDFPEPIQRFNIYRTLWLTSFYQSHGIKVIPTVPTPLPEIHSYCWSGIPEGSTVAFETIGKKKAEKNINMELIINKMIEKIKPDSIILYGEYIPEYLKDENIKVFAPFQSKHRG